MERRSTDAAPPGEASPRGSVLGHPLDPVDLAGAAELVTGWARQGSPALVVTLNPEMIVRARGDARLTGAVAAARLCVADGVGVVWAARRAGQPVPGRVPGVDLVTRALARIGDDVPAYFLGARPDVAEAAADAARRRWGVRIAGARDGYFSPEQDGAVADAVRASGARLLLAGLGERQEVFLAEQAHRLGPVVAIGVGGTLDVLAGVARRTPAWTRRLGLEWAWRVGGDPSRWHRAPRLVRFVALVLREGRSGAERR